MYTSNSQKKTYFPINDAHAIVEFVVFVQFTPQFSKPTIKKLVEGLGDNLKSDFSKANPFKTIEFQFTSAETPVSTVNSDDLSGLELQKINEDGDLEWTLRTTENAIAVHCLDYTRWDDVWAKSERYLKAAFTHIEGSSSFVSSIGVKYVDRFLYCGEPKQSDLTELFKSDPPYLVKTAFNHELWHCHSGWFDDLTEKQCLNQLNIEANFINIKDKRTLAVTIEHNAIVFMEYINGIIKEDDNKQTELSKIASELHSKNKRVLADLLSEEMQQRINLKP